MPVGDPAFDGSLCSGEDWDLYLPSLGNTLIITEDGDASDPDDAVNGNAGLVGRTGTSSIVAARAERNAKCKA